MAIYNVSELLVHTIIKRNESHDNNRRQQSKRERAESMATIENTTLSIIDPSGIGNGKVLLKAGVKTFIISPTIVSKKEAALYDHHVHNTDFIRNIFSFNYTNLRNGTTKSMLGGCTLPESWGSGESFFDSPLSNLLSSSDTTMKNLMTALQSCPRGTHEIRGTTLKVAIGPNALRTLNKEGLISYEATWHGKLHDYYGDRLSADLIIPYDVENRLIGQFIDLSVLGLEEDILRHSEPDDDLTARQRATQEWTDKQLTRLAFLSNLKEEVDKLTVLATNTRCFKEEA